MRRMSCKSGFAIKSDCYPGLLIRIWCYRLFDVIKADVLVPVSEHLFPLCISLESLGGYSSKQILQLHVLHFQTLFTFSFFPQSMATLDCKADILLLIMENWWAEREVQILALFSGNLFLEQIVLNIKKNSVKRKLYNSGKMPSLPSRGWKAVLFLINIFQMEMLCVKLVSLVGLL